MLYFIFSCDNVSLLCQLKQLKIVDIHKFLLRGIIRSEKKCLDYIIPQSVRVRIACRSVTCLTDPVIVLNGQNIT